MELTDRTPSPGLRLAIDYAPLLVFFAVNFLAPEALVIKLVASGTGFLSDLDRVGALVIARVIVATAAFVVATVAAMIVSQVKLKRISPMLWISGVLVVVFGGLTIWFQNPNFIKVKPTIVYLCFTLVLAFGLVTRRPLLRDLLGSSYPGLDEAGWRQLTINWALFFAAMAAANEAVWRLTAPRPTDDPHWWVLYKFPGCLLITLAFAAANVPMLLRHGLQADGDGVAGEMPPE